MAEFRAWFEVRNQEELYWLAEEVTPEFLKAGSLQCSWEPDLDREQEEREFCINVGDWPGADDCPCYFLLANADEDSPVYHAVKLVSRFYKKFRTVDDLPWFMETAHVGCDEDIGGSLYCVTCEGWGCLATGDKSLRELLLQRIKKGQEKV